MSIQHPDEQLWNDIVQDTELDSFFDESEAALVAKAERSVRGASPFWNRPATFGIALGFMITAGAAWMLLANHEAPAMAVSPHTTTAAPTSAISRPTMQAPTLEPTTQVGRMETRVSATSTSNRVASIERADSLQRIVTITTDTRQTPSILYSIGVLRHRAGQTTAARHALLEAEKIASSMGLTELLVKIHREQASLPTR
ncbi:hypothetical protein BH10BAC6_BH10BAC6_11760 [soil metagenome]